MDVLIFLPNLYSNVALGGGEIFYRKLIARHPEVRFHYPSHYLDHEKPPANAVPAAVTPQFVGEKVFDMAAAFAGRRFDVVDVPDFSRTALLFLGALEHFGCVVGTVALSLHGRMSLTLQHDLQPPAQDRIDKEKNVETMLYHYADVRYGISRAYLDELAAVETRRGHYMPPYFLYDDADFEPTPATGDQAPTLLFIGRYEPLKGSDLFVDLIGNIPRELYHEAVLIGPYDTTNVPRLAEMAVHRGIDLRIVGRLTHLETLAYFRRRCVLLVTSRRETLSLVTIEALMNGCPAVIGRHLGVVRALDEDFPGIPHLRIHPDEAVVSAAAVTDLLRHYDDHRAALVAYVRAHPLPRPESDITAIYGAPHDCAADIRAHIFRTTAEFLGNTQRFSDEKPAEPPPPAPVSDATNSNGMLIGVCSAALATRRSADDAAAIFQFWAAESAKWLATYQTIAGMPETTPAEVDAKWLQLAIDNASIRLDRGRRTRELARLERLRGRDLVAAAYELRVMRWQGSDVFGALPAVEAALSAGGYTEEAAVARLTYGPTTADRDAAILAYLKARRDTLKTPSAAQFARLQDGRSDAPYRASVIVSLYGAAAKLPRFLRSLVSQTLFRAGLLEVILVDSASPDDEYAPLVATLGADHRHILYVRTPQRETIQLAWNRGITLTRSPYLVFLGADEEMRPDAVERLAAVLDAAPDVDWVQSSSVVFNVSDSGAFVGDSGLYDRKCVDGLAQYLDTTYLGHVVGLYRKSLHDRFGYYDPLFRGAGDTEFKNRALPGLRVLTLPLVLGRYVNYPEQRMTAGPSAEIEDLRAWYLHRTPAGLRYGFESRDPGDLGDLLLAALQHQKCYRGNLSSDADLAVLAADLLAERDPESAALRYRPGSLALRDTWQKADFLLGPWPLAAASQVPPSMLAAEIAALGHNAGEIAHRHGRLRGLGIREDYHFLNDNRCEQHSMIWP